MPPVNSAWLKVTVPPVNFAQSKVTVPPVNCAPWKVTVPPVNFARLKVTVPPVNSAPLKVTVPPVNFAWLKVTVPPVNSASLKVTVPPVNFAPVEGDGAAGELRAGRSRRCRPRTRLPVKSKFAPRHGVVASARRWAVMTRTTVSRTWTSPGRGVPVDVGGEGHAEVGAEHVDALLPGGGVGPVVGELGHRVHPGEADGGLVVAELGGGLGVPGAEGGLVGAVVGQLEVGGVPGDLGVEFCGPGGLHPLAVVLLAAVLLEFPFVGALPPVGDEPGG